jgi:hypothetical protein
MEHDLKLWPRFFEQVHNGTRPFDLRRTDDRAFSVGDIVRFQEWDPTTQRYTGRELRRSIIAIHAPHERAGEDFPLRGDFCVLGLRQ